LSYPGFNGAIADPAVAGDYILSYEIRCLIRAFILDGEKQRRFWCRHKNSKWKNSVLAFQGLRRSFSLLSRFSAFAGSLDFWLRHANYAAGCAAVVSNPTRELQYTLSTMPSHPISL